MTPDNEAISILKYQLQYCEQSMPSREQDVAYAQELLDVNTDKRDQQQEKINSLREAIALLELSHVRRS